MSIFKLNQTENRSQIWLSNLNNIFDEQIKKCNIDISINHEISESIKVYKINLNEIQKLKDINSEIQDDIESSISLRINELMNNLISKSEVKLLKNESSKRYILKLFKDKFKTLFVN